MNISWLTIRDLEYLVAVGRTLHFAKAAEECHVSQPALSTQLKKLEDHLGVQVFERTNRRVAITDAGHEVLEQAKRILEEASRLAEIAKVSRGPLAGELRIGAIATLGPYLIPHLLPKLRRTFPDTTFIFREGLTAELLESLKKRELDVVFAADTFSDSALTVQPLFFEPFMLATPKGHPLHSKRPLLVKDLHPEEMVLLEDGHCLRDQTLQLCARNKAGKAQVFQATSLETLRHLVAAGLGYTLLPLLAVDTEPKLNSLVEYRTLPDRTGRQIILVSRKGYFRSGDVKKLAEFVIENRPKGL